MEDAEEIKLINDGINSLLFSQKKELANNSITICITEELSKILKNKTEHKCIDTKKAFLDVWNNIGKICENNEHESTINKTIDMCNKLIDTYNLDIKKQNHIESTPEEINRVHKELRKMLNFHKSYIINNPYFQNYNNTLLTILLDNAVETEDFELATKLRNTIEQINK